MSPPGPEAPGRAQELQARGTSASPTPAPGGAPRLGAVGRGGGAGPAAGGAALGGASGLGGSPAGSAAHRPARCGSSVAAPTLLRPSRVWPGQLGLPA